MKLNKLLSKFVRRAVETVDSWDGSPSAYESTEAYCKACLIDVNPKGETKKQSRCLLPAKAPGSSAYADKAIYAIAGGNGITAIKKPGDVDQGVWDSAVTRAAKTVVQAYKDLDREAPAKVMDLAGMSRAIAVDQVFGQLQAAIYEGMTTWGGESYGYLVTVYIDNGELYALFGKDGVYTRTLLTIEDNDTVTVGNPESVTQEFVPVQRSSVSVQRMDNGNYRLFMLAATAIINRVGQIDSTALFDDMIQRANDYNYWPTVDFFHLGDEIEGIDFGQVDFLAREGVCYIASAVLDGSHPLTDPMVRSLITEPAYWGCSIEYYPALDGIEFIDVDGLEVPVFTKGLNTRITILPEAEAASWATNIDCLNKETRAMNGKQQEALKKLLGEDEYKKRMTDVGSVNGNVDKAKLIFRAQGDGGTANPPAAEVPATDTAADKQEEAELTAQIELDDEAVIAIVQRAVTSEAFTTALSPLFERLEQLNALVAEVKQAIVDMDEATDDRLNALEETDEIKLRTLADDLPRKRSLQVTYRPREQAVEGGEPLTLTQVAANGVAAMNGKK